MRKRPMTDKAARSTRLQRYCKPLVAIAAIVGIVPLVGCNGPSKPRGGRLHSAAASFAIDASTNANVMSALQRYIDKTPIYFAIVKREQIFKTAIIDTRLVRHNVVSLSPSENENGKADFLEMSITPGGMALLHRLHARRYRMNGGVSYVVVIGNRVFDKELNVRKFSPLPKTLRGGTVRCVKVTFTSTLILNQAGRQVMAVASAADQLAVGLPPINRLMTGGIERGPTFSEAGTRVIERLLVCEATNGKWKVDFPICRLCK